MEKSAVICIWHKDFHRFSHLGGFSEPKKFCHLDPEAPGKPFYRVQRRIGETALYPTHVRACNSASICKSLLRDAARLAQLPHPCAK